MAQPSNGAMAKTPVGHLLDRLKSRRSAVVAIRASGMSQPLHVLQAIYTQRARVWDYYATVRMPGNPDSIVLLLLLPLMLL